MSRSWSLLTGAAMGAGLMFMLDPARGRRRRALLRDAIVGATHKTRHNLDALSRDVMNRARGTAAEVQARFRHDAPDVSTAPDADVSSFPGGAQRSVFRTALLHEGWSPSTALLVAATSGALAAGWGYKSHKTHTTH